VTTPESTYDAAVIAAIGQTIRQDAEDARPAVDAAVEAELIGDVEDWKPTGLFPLPATPTTSTTAGA
jgi:hypothetical protein